ncbi:MAG: DUF523 domain-containing protein [Sedimentibacter sp.]|uniref:DUF523 domain-containing protein n=1 Tax=Sedimentibacter sp. TaxID=1960295 RepID=UPI0031581528
MENNIEYIVSACLCGEKCRYDGKSSLSQNVKKLVDDGRAIMACPEIEGKLSVPRHPCEISRSRIINDHGEDMTENFMEGARKVLELAEKHNIKKAILKEKSPSCGSKFVYDGTFSRKLVKGQGITTKLLREHGIEVISDEDF